MEKFQIPPISATIAGHNYTTKPIEVEVTQRRSPGPSARQAARPADQDQAPSADSLKDKVLIMVSVDKTNAYLNERIPA